MSHSSLALWSLARTSLWPESGSSLPGLQSTMPGLCLQQYCLLNRYANFLQGSVEKGDECFNSCKRSKVKKVFSLVSEIVQWCGEKVWNWGNQIKWSKLCTFYQPAACKPHGQLVLKLLYIFHICLFVGLWLCASTFINESHCCHASLL